uniref:EF-hand domain-containing protein n=1 Tax=Romanomermis culicivorax TaxID=13658 RepID=A0A915HJ56_ROMCU
MTQFFTQKDIDEFREAFYLYAQPGTLENPAHLRYIMRCLGYSPTVEETEKYFKVKRDKIDFACFLEILHKHSTSGRTAGHAILEAFKAYDRTKSGAVLAKELKSVLTGVGERLTPREVEMIFEEANIGPRTMVRYDDFMKLISSPLPDYFY